MTKHSCNQYSWIHRISWISKQDYQALKKVKLLEFWYDMMFKILIIGMNDDSDKKEKDFNLLHVLYKFIFDILKRYHLRVDLIKNLSFFGSIASLNLHWYFKAYLINILNILSTYKNFLNFFISIDRCLFEINSFIIQALPSEDINEGEIGLSSIFRDMMRISKMDKVQLKLPRIREQNPLNSIEL